MMRFFRKAKFSRSKYFDRVYKENLFHGQESLSGEGSSLEATNVLRREIPKLLKDYSITSILDAPCGDLNWMKQILPLSAEYTGADISMNVIKLNKKLYRGYKFIQLDVVRQKPASFDLILCRDLLVHLPLKEALEVLKNFSKSGSKYLLTTNFTDRKNNEDFLYSPSIVQWRPLNLSLEPFSLSDPIAIIVEECTEGDGMFADKTLALYDLRTLENLL